MIDIIALPLFLLWLISSYFNPALDLQHNGNDINSFIESNSHLVTNPVVKTSSGFVRGVIKTVMATKVDTFLGVKSPKYSIIVIYIYISFNYCIMNVRFLLPNHH